MNKLILLALVFFNLSVQAQSEIKITTKRCLPEKGYHLRLKDILNDSRCPENVTCIWAGEVSAIVEVYNNRQFVEEKTLTFNSKNSEENNLWLSGYYSKEIKTIAVLPYPKQGIVVKPKKKYIKIVFAD